MVLAFEENGSSKIGVRFDKSIPEGNDLGGLCDEDHGFFCAGNTLLPHLTHDPLLLPGSVMPNNRACLFGGLIFFSSTADLLRLDSSSTDEIDKLAINELFEVFANIPLGDTIPFQSRVSLVYLLCFIYVGCFK